jgi:hypothetical protein
LGLRGDWMTAFLVALSWCDPEEVAACKRGGLDDDPRCSTGIFIEASTGDEALAWGKAVADKYMEFLFREKKYAPEALELFCWIKPDPRGSSWKHCLEFFPRVSVGQFPEFHRMTTEAYSQWCKQAGVS